VVHARQRDVDQRRMAPRQVCLGYDHATPPKEPSVRRLSVAQHARVDAYLRARSTGDA
jgi:hypothetical protein